MTNIPSQSSDHGFLDAAIQGMAIANGASSMALETTEEQIAMMAEFNEQSLDQLRQPKCTGAPVEQDSGFG